MAVIQVISIKFLIIASCFSRWDIIKIVYCVPAVETAGNIYIMDRKAGR